MCRELLLIKMENQNYNQKQNKKRTHHWELNSHDKPDKKKEFKTYTDDQCISIEK